MLVTYVYIHSHNCALKGEVHEDRCQVNRGVAYPIRPVCIETLTELELLRVERDGYVN